MSPGPVTDIAQQLRDLLAHDRSLSPTDRKVLETLLLHPAPTPARELSRATGANLQGLYGSLERLTSRGLIEPIRNGGAMRYRTAHPSVAIRALAEPARRAAEIAGTIEATLRDRYEQGVPPRDESEPGRVRSTRSSTTAASWLLQRVGSAQAEVLFLGDEGPWFAPGSALEQELERRGTARGVRIRMIVGAPRADDGRAERHARLERLGVGLRYSSRFYGRTILVDQRWMLTATGTGTGAREEFVEVDAPALCRDLSAIGQETWQELPAAGRSRDGGGPARPTPAGSGRSGSDALADRAPARDPAASRPAGARVR